MLRRALHVRAGLVAVLALVCAVSLGCSVNVKKGEDGEDKNVDIKTPIGGIHVDQGASASDTGIAVYPGARPKKKSSDDDHDENNANVNLSAFGFGLRVVAIDYESDDPPAKLIAFYKDQLKKFGDVLECHTSSDTNVTYNRKDEGKSKKLTCDQDSGSNVELKVGTEDNQHIVSIKPAGKGSTFALVYVRTHGRDTI